jgi:hypothetical protein
MFYNPANISYILASISQVSGLMYISLLAYQVTEWYLESQVFQYANISWHEQSFSMPVYHGMNKVSSMPVYHGMSKVSVCRYIMAWAKVLVCRYIMAWAKVSVCRHIMAWAKFQCASISGHKQSFGVPAYQGIRNFLVCQHIVAST